MKDLVGRIADQPWVFADAKTDITLFNGFPVHRRVSGGPIPFWLAASIPWLIFQYGAVMAQTLRAVFRYN
ncbi:MAG: hypothetical protein JOZ31_21000 [Verrucomicrobia bacterium]|nr:hypothetical protein [Verrucomicrobiota bacterium]